LNFKLTICPDEGFYKNGKFVFSFKIGSSYPHEPPKVKCETQVYHPNIDLEGNVCLNILREDWKPVLTINSIVLWSSIPVSGAESGRSPQQGGCRCASVKSKTI